MGGGILSNTSSNWPELPLNCPLDGAAPRPGDLYRFSDPADSGDWQLPIQRYGADHFSDATERDYCRAHALSVFIDIEAARKFQSKYPKFRGHSIIRFQITDKCGVVIKDRPHGGHHCLWPTDEFAVPPAMEVVT